eukprot:snap_masked-scaffold_29-processed-gene-0.18-mRNA-1 protein AED:1.00 eAED:1.00 QI:0/-1/0/0/-1/1/1/0/409
MENLMPISLEELQQNFEDFYQVQLPTGEVYRKLLELNFIPEKYIPTNENANYYSEKKINIQQNPRVIKLVSLWFPIYKHLADLAGHRYTQRLRNGQNFNYHIYMLGLDKQVNEGETESELHSFYLSLYSYMKTSLQDMKKETRILQEMSPLENQFLRECINSRIGENYAFYMTSTCSGNPLHVAINTEFHPLFMNYLFYGIVSALREMEEKGYVHLNVSSKSISFKNNGQPILIDFSKVMRFEELSEEVDMKYLDVFIIPPEVRVNGRITYGGKCDLFCLAASIVQIFASQRSLFSSEIANDFEKYLVKEEVLKQIIQKVKKARDLKVQSKEEVLFLDVLSSCIEFNVDLRLTLEEVVKAGKKQWYFLDEEYKELEEPEKKEFVEYLNRDIVAALKKTTLGNNISFAVG